MEELGTYPSIRVSAACAPLFSAVSMIPQLPYFIRFVTMTFKELNFIEIKNILFIKDNCMKLI